MLIAEVNHLGANRPGLTFARPGRSLAHLRKLAQVGTLAAERLTAGARAQIFALNVVASIAARVVVVDPREDRMPRQALGHVRPPFD